MPAAPQPAPSRECWACSILVEIPLSPCGSGLAPLFQCGWCGAVCEAEPQFKRAVPRAWLTQLAWRIFVAVFVAALIASVSGMGVFLLLPRLCRSRGSYVAHVAGAGLLTAQVVLHFICAYTRPPGDVAACGLVPARPVQQGACFGYRRCTSCNAAKPPGTHHCSSCGVCVVDMDHHCPFIANCVGRGNRRPFLLLLLWLLAAALYVVAACAALLAGNWPEVTASAALLRRNSTSSVGSSSSSIDQGVSDGAQVPQWALATAGPLLLLLHAAPVWLLATAWLLAIACALLVGVGSLLTSQLWYLATGLTYVQTLKQQQQQQQQQQAICGDAAAQSAALPPRATPRLLLAHMQDVLLDGSLPDNMGAAAVALIAALLLPDPPWWLAPRRHTKPKKLA